MVTNLSLFMLGFICALSVLRLAHIVVSTPPQPKTVPGAVGVPIHGTFVVSTERNLQQVRSYSRRAAGPESGPVLAEVVEESDDDPPSFDVAAPVRGEMRRHKRKRRTGSLVADVQPPRQCGEITWQFWEPECTDDFFGCYSTKERHQLYNASGKKHVPCGFHKPSAVDALRDDLAADLENCTTLIYTANFGRQGGVIQLPPARQFQSDVLGLVCHALILDETSAEGLQFGEASEWRIFTMHGEMPYESLAHSYKVLKLLGSRFLPANIQHSMFLDTHVLHRNHTFDSIIDWLHSHHTSPITVFAHPYTHDMMTEFANADRRIRKHRGDVAKFELDPLSEQKELYAEYGYPTDHALHIQSNVVIRNYAEDKRDCTALIECAWSTEINLFSYRDQPSFTFVVDQLNLWTHVNVRPHSEKLGLLTDYGRIEQAAFRGFAQFDGPFVYDDELRANGMSGVLREQA